MTTYTYTYVQRNLPNNAIKDYIFLKDKLDKQYYEDIISISVSIPYNPVFTNLATASAIRSKEAIINVIIDNSTTFKLKVIS